MASSLRTDRRAFRKLALADAAFTELREVARIADGLTTEENRLANRMREQLWRCTGAQALAILKKPAGCSRRADDGIVKPGVRPSTPR